MSIAWEELVGLEVLSIHLDSSGEPKMIFFKDGETYIQLQPQDPYDYHDCSSSARTLQLVKDAKGWARWREYLG